MTLRLPPICGGCTHFQLITETTGTCDAFPDGIPADIWLSDADHREPVCGDHGIQFAAKDIRAERYAAVLFSR
jgi:hypothetical protein